jgi:hypothetical protein
MKSTFKMSILALSVGLMTVISSCGDKSKPAADGGVDTNTTVEVKAVDTTKTVTPDSTASSSTTTTTTEVNKEEKAK